MAYAYRNMTAEERDAMIAWRIAQGWPLHSPPHPLRRAGTYILTAATFEHLPVMADPERRTGFSSELLRTFQEIEATISAWVVLPNHYHVLAAVPSLETVSAALGRLHGSTSRAWNGAEHTPGRRVWYRFTDRLIRGVPHFYRAFNYIHGNPVKHGYAERPDVWPWSSLQDYLLAEHSDWMEIIETRFPPDGLDWSWDDH